MCPPASGVADFRCHPDPVSYTHLDVYKRQMYPSAILQTFLSRERSHFSGSHSLELHSSAGANSAEARWRLAMVFGEAC